MKDFPILKRKVNGKKLVYLDNAATSLTPRQVIDEMNAYYSSMNANVHRAPHTLGSEASEKYDEAHKTVAGFVGARQEELVFTKNATEAINLLAYTLTKDLSKKDNVVVTEMEHHSNFVPWQQLSKEKGFQLRIVPVEREGVNEDSFKELIDGNTRIIAVSHVSNVLGSITPIKKVRKMAKKAKLIVDGAQSVPHMPVNVKELDVDFMAFSAHKMLGPTGIGALYGKKKLLEEMTPFNYGGDMVEEVTLKKTTFNDLPWKFEAGTPNIAGGIGFAAAVNYLNKKGMSKVRKHSESMGEAAKQIIEDLGGEVYGPAKRIGLASFNFPSMHSFDLSVMLDREGVMTRSGHHCAMPLHQKLGVENSCRASTYIYNNDEDLEIFAEALQKTLKKLK